MWLIAILLMVLIGVLLFREELRTLIGLVLVIGFGYAFWTSDGIGGKLIVLGFAALVVAGVVYEWMKIHSEEQQQVPAPNAPPTARVDGWFYLDSRNIEQGPISEDHLLTLLRSRKLPPDTSIRWGSTGDWRPANRLWANRF